MRVAVVGAGIMGASTALALADRGHEVTIFEQLEINHRRGSSHGRSRIIRKAYPDAYYTELMAEGYPMWHKLQERVPEPIVFESGLLYFGNRDSSTVSSLVAGLRENGVEQIELDPQTLSSVFPELYLQDGEVGYLTREAGWVQAKKAVRYSVELAVAQGAVVRREQVDPVQLAKEYDAVLVCAGSWAKKMFDLPVKVILQTFGYLEVPQPFNSPVWIDDHEHNIYGLPSEPGARTVKFGVHSDGREIDPSDPDRAHSEEHLGLLHDFARKRFGIANPVIGEVTTCIYTRTATEDFIFGQPAPNVFFASPCSGHGFKFGPWIGARMADFAEGVRRPEEYPRFYQGAT